MLLLGDMLSKILAFICFQMCHAAMMDLHEEGDMEDAASTAQSTHSSHTFVPASERKRAVEEGMITRFRGANVTKGTTVELWRSKHLSERGENLLRTYRFYLSTEAGPVAGVLFKSATSVSFYTEGPDKKFLQNVQFRNFLIQFC